MDQVCISPLEKARNASHRVFKAFSPDGRHGKAHAVAAVLGWSDTRVSDVKNKHLEEALVLLYALGFKLVSSDKVCVSADELRVLRKCYSRAVENEAMAHQLFGDDE